MIMWLKIFISSNYICDSFLAQLASLEKEEIHKFVDM